jgi:cytochrome P450
MIELRDSTAVPVPVVSAGIPVVDFDPFSPDTLSDPHRIQDHLRSLGPVLWMSCHGTYGVARFDEVNIVLKNAHEYTSLGGSGLTDIRKPDSWRDPSVIVDSDPPEHTAIRAAMNKIITPRVVRGWRDAFAEAAETLCDEVLATDRFDAVADLTETYVLKVFPEALGLEVERENLLTIGRHNFNSIGPKNALFWETEAAVQAIWGWYLKSQEQESMIPGGFGELIFEAEARGDLPKGGAAGMLRSLLRGGMDTTIAGLGTTLWLLASDSVQWAAVKADPGLVRNAFEEALRVESPIQTYFRTTRQDVVLAGVSLAPNTKVQIFSAAANRDECKWDHPERFDVKRRLTGHLALGMGIHVCLGQMIARLEAECLLSAFVRRVAKVEVDGPVRYRASNALRTLEVLPLRITRE